MPDIFSAHPAFRKQEKKHWALKIKIIASKFALQLKLLHPYITCLDRNKVIDSFNHKYQMTC